MPAELKLRENTDYSYSIMSTVDSDVMPREVGVICISTDGHDQKIFWGLKFLFRGFFLGRKIWQVFFGWLVLSRRIRDFVTNSCGESWESFCQKS